MIFIEGCWYFAFATWMDDCAAKFETTFVSSEASLSSDSKFAMGLPESAFVLSAVLIGIAPRNGTFKDFAMSSAPPLPKISYSLPSSPMKYDMFSTMPSTGICSCSNIAMARVASSCATFWGVQTTTAPVSGSSCDIVSGTSPVPGGRSMMR